MEIKDPYPYFKGIKDTNNCCVIAFTICFKTNYKGAYRFLQKHGRIKGKGMFVDQIENVFKNIRRNKVVKGPFTSQNRITINQFVKKYPKGRYFCLVRGHAVAIVDGVVYDHSARPKRQIQHAWRVILKED